MKKLFSAITILLIFQNLFSQNKKEQIEILTKSLDSINTVLIKERMILVFSKPNMNKPFIERNLI